MLTALSPHLIAAAGMHWKRSFGAFTLAQLASLPRWLHSVLMPAMHRFADNGCVRMQVHITCACLAAYPLLCTAAACCARKRRHSALCTRQCAWLHASPQYRTARQAL